MALALSLGRRGLGRVWPNPAVGCVIVKDGLIVGRGWTQAGGRPHAETHALTQAGAAAQGADVYVTLEPCAHQGETPPCAQALIDAGVARVIAALGDPDDRVAGRGFQMLRDAGIEIVTGVLEAEARKAHAGFLSKVTQGRPHLTLKLATSLDGKIATAEGDSKWITGPEARRRVHALRATHDAVLIGGGTARDDDPSLTVRGLGVSHQPVRVVASAELDLPMTGALAQSAGEIPVWIFHGSRAQPELKDAWLGLGAQLFDVPLLQGSLDVEAILTELGAAGLTRVFCEGGGRFAASLMKADLVDQLLIFNGGVGIGADGRAALGELGLSKLAQAPRFELDYAEPIAGDVLQAWSRTRA